MWSFGNLVIFQRLWSHPTCWRYINKIIIIIIINCVQVIHGARNSAAEQQFIGSSEAARQHGVSQSFFDRFVQDLPGRPEGLSEGPRRWPHRLCVSPTAADVAGLRPSSAGSSSTYPGKKTRQSGTCHPARWSHVLQTTCSRYWQPSTTACPRYCNILDPETGLQALRTFRGVARNLFWGYEIFGGGIKLNTHVQ